MLYSRVIKNMFVVLSFFLPKIYRCGEEGKEIHSFIIKRAGISYIKKLSFVESPPPTSELWTGP